MGDFNAGPGLTDETGLVGTEPNLAEPQKRMLSSMTPTILERPDGSLFALLGTVGGRTIINSVLQVTLNMIELDMGVLEAVSARRIHHQWLPDEIRAESGAIAEDVAADLERRGHALARGGEWGGVHTLQIGEDGTRLGAPDPRRTDAAAVGH